MAAPLKEEVREEAEDWLTTYADAITLLMAFFVMLLTFAEFDIPAYEELSSALAGTLGNREEQTTSQSLKIDVQDIVYSSQADQVITVDTDDKGVVIELQSNAFFAPASADLVPAAIPVLTKLSETLSSPRYELYNVVVEGHTDDGAINTPKFPSNWELSAGRASSVVRLFEDNNVDRSRLTAAGFADTRPKVPNRDLNGDPIPENRATNRRVVLRLSPMSLSEREAYLRAQDFKRQQAEAKALRDNAAPKSLSTRIAVPTTPDSLDDGQRQIKLALDNVIREIHSRGQSGTLSADDLKLLRSQVEQLTPGRDSATAPFFDAITSFLNTVEQEKSTAPAPAPAS